MRHQAFRNVVFSHLFFTAVTGVCTNNGSWSYLQKGCELLRLSKSPEACCKIFIYTCVNEHRQRGIEFDCGWCTKMYSLL